MNVPRVLWQSREAQLRWSPGPCQAPQGELETGILLADPQCKGVLIE